MNHRVIDRNPISGLGLPPNGTAAAERRQRAAARETDNRNPILGQGDLGEEVKVFSMRLDGHKSNRGSQNPLNHQQQEGTCDFADDLRPRGRPGKARTAAQAAPQSQRDPIAGSGEFGVEWDPIYRYAGRHRHDVGQTLEEWQSSRSNPVTGEGTESYEINEELKTHRKPTSNKNASNPLTGENCQTYAISDKLNERHAKSRSRRESGNPLTGENCQSQEPRSMVPRKIVTPGNPVTGEGCEAYSHSIEFKQRPAAAANLAEERNPLTGENCQVFILNDGEKPRILHSNGDAAVRCNPLTGEGCRQFGLGCGVKKRQGACDSGNPLTGDNLASFDIHREQLRTKFRPSCVGGGDRKH